MIFKVSSIPNHSVVLWWSLQPTDWLLRWIQVDGHVKITKYCFQTGQKLSRYLTFTEENQCHGSPLGYLNPAQESSELQFVSSVSLLSTNKLYSIVLCRLSWCGGWHWETRAPCESPFLVLHFCHSLEQLISKSQVTEDKQLLIIADTVTAYCVTVLFWL